MHMVKDGFEIYWMKRLIERDNAQLSVLNKLIGGYYLIANYAGDATYFPATQEIADERIGIWQAFLGGDCIPMRNYLENREFNEKWGQAAF